MPPGPVIAASRRVIAILVSAVVLAGCGTANPVATPAAIVPTATVGVISYALTDSVVDNQRVEMSTVSGSSPQRSVR